MYTKTHKMRYPLKIPSEKKISSQIKNMNRSHLIFEMQFTPSACFEGYCIKATNYLALIFEMQFSPSPAIIYLIRIENNYRFHNIKKRDKTCQGQESRKGINHVKAKNRKTIHSYSLVYISKDFSTRHHQHLKQQPQQSYNKHLHKNKKKSHKSVKWLSPN